MGTALERSKVPLRHWIRALYLVSADPALSARRLQRITLAAAPQTGAPH